MKYALVNNFKTEAQKDLKGYCPICESELTAKCGDFKIHHWSHKKIRNCDPWWENETEWHRNWKNNYPAAWQEFPFKDQKTDEKHIADIYTAHGLVIEFQHSNINPEERNSRELYYKNMIWIVDGTRLKRDYLRFLKAFKDFKKTEKKGIYMIDQIEEVFPSNWINSSVPVLFDFKGLDELKDKTDLRNNLYCLLPVRQGWHSIIAEVPRDAFLRTTINSEWTSRTQNFIESLLPKKEQQIEIEEIQPQPAQREGTHYYDHKKGRFIKRRRF
jgi:hypothetical protein